MAEDIDTKAAADAAQADADAKAKAAEQTRLSDDEVKKIIAERDKAKEKARKYEDDEKKRAEQKRIEEGELKTVLAEKEKMIADLQSKASAFEAQQNKLRESIIAKVPEEFKDVAVDIHDIDKLSAFVDKINAQKTTQTQVMNAKGQIHSESLAQAKTIDEFASLLKAQGLA